MSSQRQSAVSEQKSVLVIGSQLHAPCSPLAAFTLLELLVVIGLIATMMYVLFSGLAGGGKSIAVQSAQATVSSLVTAARIKSTATNRKTRLLVNADPVSHERYLRMIVLQLARQPGSSPVDWDTIQSILLPAGAYVVPGSLIGLGADAAEWKRISDPSEDLVSDLFRNQSLTYWLEGDSAAQLWTGVTFTPNGTLSALAGGPPPKGTIVIAPGQLRAPETFQTGEPPVQLGSAKMVRGLILSAYGVPALLNERSAF